MSTRQLDILVADDHRLTRDIVGEILLAIDCTRVRYVEDGASAVSEIMAAAPDIAIVDYDMPFDGLSVLEFVRRSTASLDDALPIIVMTSLTARKRVLALRDAGANEILTKPFTARTILSRIAAVIDTPRPFIRTPNFVGPDRRRNQSIGYTGPLRREADGLWL